MERFLSIVIPIFIVVGIAAFAFRWYMMKHWAPAAQARFNQGIAAAVVAQQAAVAQNGGIAMQPVHGGGGAMQAHNPAHGMHGGMAPPQQVQVASAAPYGGQPAPTPGQTVGGYPAPTAAPHGATQPYAGASLPYSGNAGAYPGATPGGYPGATPGGYPGAGAAPGGYPAAGAPPGY